ncbi:MAG TPA: nuclear transport factor 2 family protein [Pyrinomonadaceae bacterium]|nr:nuclear transport factor 2 family protein [Pyrinomonadaceae bacterium]
MKVRLILAIVLTFVFASIARSQEPAASPSPAPKPAMSRAQSQRIIIATEKKLWEAWKNKNIKLFKSTLSADSVMIGDTGVANKTEALKALEAPCEVKSFELSDLKVTFLNSSAALLTYKAISDATCAGQPVPPTVWASSAYVMRGGKWLAASHQETPAK